jgi:hypothetical protein
MILDINELSSFVNPLECVAAIAVIVAPPIWCSVVTEEHHTCMIGLWCESKEIKEGIIIQ